MYVYVHTHKYLTNILFVPLATLCVCVCGTNPGRKTNLRMIPGNFYVLFVHKQSAGCAIFQLLTDPLAVSQISASLLK